MMFTKARIIIVKISAFQSFIPSVGDDEFDNWNTEDTDDRPEPTAELKYKTDQVAIILQQEYTRLLHYTTFTFEGMFMVNTISMLHSQVFHFKFFYNDLK